LQEPDAVDAAVRLLRHVLIPGGTFEAGAALEGNTDGLIGIPGPRVAPVKLEDRLAQPGVLWLVNPALPVRHAAPRCKAHFS
jgi:hypothetical protein